MLTVLALALLLVVGANTNNLVPFYAIGVFTGFSMAGFGMARYHTRTREPAWRGGGSSTSWPGCIPRWSW